MKPKSPKKKSPKPAPEIEHALIRSRAGGSAASPTVPRGRRPRNSRAVQITARPAVHATRSFGGLKRGAADRACTLPAAENLQQLRVEALAEIGAAMRELIPRARRQALAGRPALLRLVARWFRMPTLKELPTPPPLITARERDLERQMREARRWYNDAQERVMFLEYKFGVRKKDDSPQCRKALDPDRTP